MLKHNTAPTIDGSRIRLRAHKNADFDSYANLFASERAIHMGQLKRRHAWYAFASEVGHWSLFGFGPWAIEHLETGQFTGQVGILKHDHFPEPEIGWFLLEGQEGKGLAYEAAQLALGWVAKEVVVASLVSYIDPNNHRSIQPAKRLGAVLDTEAKGEDETDLVYRHRLTQK